MTPKRRTGAGMTDEEKRKLDALEVAVNATRDALATAGGKLYALGKDAKYEDVLRLIIEIGGTLKNLERVGGKRK